MEERERGEGKENGEGERGRGEGKERGEGEREEVEKMEKLSRYGYNLHLPSSLLGLAEFSRCVKEMISA